MGAELKRHVGVRNWHVFSLPYPLPLLLLRSPFSVSP